MKKVHLISILSTALVLASAIFLTNCKGKDGAVGPQGDKGATGAVGAAGPAGPAGAKGDPGISTGTGTNNVIQVTFTRTFVPPSPSQGTEYFYFPAVITTDMLNNSALVIYVKTSNFPGSWVAVPGAGIANADVADVLRYTFHADTRDIGIVRESGTSIKTITQVRVVIIPAGTSINGRKAAPELDLKDYAAVKAYYHLPD